MPDDAPQTHTQHTHTQHTHTHTPELNMRPRQRRVGAAGQLDSALPERLKELLIHGKAAAAESFTGLTADGTSRRGLFPLHRTGVSLAPVAAAAEQFLAALTPAERDTAIFAIDSDQWRDLVQHPPLPDAPRRFPARPDRCAACHGPGPGAREPQRQRLRHRAQCHEAERPHSRADRPSRGIRRVVLLAQRLRRASRGHSRGAGRSTVTI